MLTIMPKPKIKQRRWRKELEEPIRKRWKKEKTYSFNPESSKPVFSIDTPPPYVNKPIHIGQATTYVLMDMFARFHRMLGEEVLFPLGLDRNGLPIEMAVEEEFDIKMNEVSREKFLQKCKQLLEKSSLASEDYFSRLGISFNSWEPGEEPGDMYLTDSESYRKLTQTTFIRLWKKGLIQEDERINNYCPGCRTTIADAEVEYKTLPSTFNFIKFRVKETGEEMVIGTTRPELIPTCAMVIYHPEDERYHHLEGKTMVTPIFENEVPIKPHPSADPEKGTGLMMMCSMGDLTDIRFFREQGLEPKIAINRDGRMNENAGFLQGLKVEEAREKITRKLKEEGLLVKQKKTEHRTPICERSKDPIEFISMPEFYLEQLKFKETLKKITRETNFFSDWSRQLLLDWIDSIKINWPISRRRYYATEIPLWYCKHCGETIVPPEGEYYQPWKEDPPMDKCPQCGSTEFRGEERVFDTWFDSSNSPLHILQWSQDEDFFESHSPCSLRPQGKEIIRTWLYYTLLKCYLLTGDKIFEDVWINYHVLDEDGRKMSKSQGNIIDPGDILDKYGAEPFRLWVALEGDLTQTDFRCSMDRIEAERKFLTKLWNVARFISQFEPRNRPEELVETDKWILKELNRLVEYTREHYQNYDFHRPSTKLRNFIWETFASHYIELVKTRAYNQGDRFPKEKQKSALYTLYEVLTTLLKLLAPVIPYITSQIYEEVKGKDVHQEKFPEVKKELVEAELPFSTEELLEVNSKMWKAKKDEGLSLKSEVQKLVLPEKFKPLEPDLKMMHKVKEIELGKLKIILE